MVLVINFQFSFVKKEPFLRRLDSLLLHKSWPFGEAKQYGRNAQNGGKNMRNYYQVKRLRTAIERFPFRG